MRGSRDAAGISRAQWCHVRVEVMATWSWLERVHLEEQVRKPGKSTDKTSRQNMTMTSEPKFQEHKKL